MRPRTPSLPSIASIRQIRHDRKRKNRRENQNFRNFISKPPRPTASGVWSCKVVTTAKPKSGRMAAKKRKRRKNKKGTSCPLFNAKAQRFGKMSGLGFFATLREENVFGKFQMHQTQRTQRVAEEEEQIDLDFSGFFSRPPRPLRFKILAVSHTKARRNDDPFSSLVFLCVFAFQF